MDFREYEILRDGDEVVIVGTIRDPVNWDFTIRFCEDDVPGVTWLIFRKAMVSLLLRSIFKWKKHHHWSQEHSEHLVEGRRRRDVAQAKAEERLKASKEGPAPRKIRPARAVGRTVTEG
jgi:ribosomal protein S12